MYPPSDVPAILVGERASMIEVLAMIVWFLIGVELES